MRQNVTANNIIGSIQKRLQNYELALIQARAFLMNIENLNQETFQKYLNDTELMERYPGMQALAYVQNVLPVNLEQHVKYKRSETPHYKIWPQTEGIELMPVAYIAPIDGRNSRAIGFNMMSEPVRRSAMEKARDTGRPILSDKMALMQENGIDYQPGIILFVPIYGKTIPSTLEERRQQLTAFVTSPFRIRDLINAIVPEDIANNIGFRIYSSEAASVETLLYEQWNGSSTISNDKPVLIKNLSISGNIYKFHFYNGNRAEQFKIYFFPLILAFLGMALTFLILKIYYIIQQQNVLNELAIASKDEFLSIASHELKTPITSLLLQIQMTRREFFKKEGSPPNTERQLKLLDNSLLQVSKLTRLIDDLLETTKVENGRLTFHFEKTDLTKLINQTIHGHSELITAAGINMDLNLPEGITIECDHFRIEQVVSNLLTNAIKYGEGSPIKIILLKQDGNVYFSIKDHGPGIPQGLQESIFERFKRVSANQSISGLGLGLYITKQIVMAHKGSIQVKSLKDEGAEFLVVLPVNQA